MTSRRFSGDRGAAVVETAIMAPVVLTLLAFLTFCGRLTSVRQNLDSATADAARAASLASSPWEAESDAVDVVRCSLADASVSCADLVVSIDAGDLRPGGSVVAEVSCSVSLSQLAALPVPGVKTIVVQRSHVVDRFRSAGS